MELGKKYVVYSVRKTDKNGATVWVRAGTAVANSDGSSNVHLDVLPLDGKLHIREAADATVFAGSAANPPSIQPQPALTAVAMVDTQSMGDH